MFIALWGWRQFCFSNLDVSWSWLHRKADITPTEAHSHDVNVISLVCLNSLPNLSILLLPMSGPFISCLVLIKNFLSNLPGLRSCWSTSDPCNLYSIQVTQGPSSISTCFQLCSGSLWPWKTFVTGPTPPKPLRWNTLLLQDPSWLITHIYLFV